VVGDERDVVVSDVGLDRWAACFMTIQAFEIWGSLGAWVTSAHPDLGPGIRERIAHAATVSELDAHQQRVVRASIEEHLRSLLPAGAVLCLPTAPGAAPRRDAPSAELEGEFRAKAIALLCIAGLGGLPQVTLPLGTIDGCPIGLSILGAPGADRALLALAAQPGLGADDAT
jgi:amidase